MLFCIFFDKAGLSNALLNEAMCDDSVGDYVSHYADKPHAPPAAVHCRGRQGSCGGEL